MNQSAWTAYLKSQVIANVLINCVLNGVIAYFIYNSRETIPLVEIAVDIQITVAIIAFFVAWIGISAARKKIDPGNPGRSGKISAGIRFFRFPANAVLRSLLIMAVLMLVYGGLVLTGSFFLLNLPELSNWAYIALKTVYTGACAASAVAIAITSVMREYRTMEYTQ